MDNPLYTQLFTQAEIDRRIDEIAREILTSYHDSRPLFVALLRGANPFASKLMFAGATKPRLSPRARLYDGQYLRPGADR